jgi:hypothetical protein
MSDAAIKFIKRELGRCRQLSHQLGKEVMGGAGRQLVRIDSPETVEDLPDRLVLWRASRRSRRRRK